jgi:hypothetical protein
VYKITAYSISALFRGVKTVQSGPSTASELAENMSERVVSAT